MVEPTDEQLDLLAERSAERDERRSHSTSLDDVHQEKESEPISEMQEMNEAGPSSSQNQVKVGGVTFNIPEMSKEYVDFMEKISTARAETGMESGAYRMSFDDIVQEERSEPIHIEIPLSQEDLLKSPLKETQQTEAFILNLYC